MNSFSLLSLIVNVGLFVYGGHLDALLKEKRDLYQRIRDVMRELDGNDCNSNGFYYDDVNGCACFTCFTGVNCETLKPNCTLEDTGGNPKLFEYYWREQNGMASTEAVYYRSPYQFGVTMLNEYINNHTNNPYYGQLLPVLSQKILQLHSIVGNIKNSNKKNIVIGHGASNLIAAAEYACKQLYGVGRDMYVFAQVPYYDGYTADLTNGVYNGLSFSKSLSLKNDTVIEFVTVPNNPDNKYREPYYKNAACTIYDDVYLWPSITNLADMNTPLESEISLFSMSKLTGHAGTRFGWALLDNPKLANKMSEYIYATEISISIDAQYRAFTLFDYLTTDNNANDFFNWVKSQMTPRWTSLNTIFNPNTQNRFIQHAKSGGFYAWIECILPSETHNCASVFESVGVQPIPGSSFGATNAFVRMEIVTAKPVWDLIVQRLQTLV